MKKLILLIAALALMAGGTAAVASDPIPQCYPCGDGPNQ